ncbi:rRNA biogenesis protein RRP36 [Leucoagaricus sp. SymC.cos]|nr:rRNA biogenesis protein RRP36 [Leucoagaricus sp. SymC.cos]
MSRRPRPSHRAPPCSQRNSPRKLPATIFDHQSKVVNKGKSPELPLDDRENEDSHAEDLEDEENSGHSSEESEEDNLDSDEGDAYAPRMSQWVDDDEELDGEFEEEREADDVPETEEYVDELALQLCLFLAIDLSQLPFGTLKKAEYVLNHAEVVTGLEADDDEESDDDSISASEDDGPVAQTSNGKSSVEWSTKPRRDIGKRSNKHAPMEVTSKKPASRFRQVVEVKKTESRDPRFLPITGEFKADKFQESYGFLTEVHGSELSTLRDNLKRAKKMLQNAPRHLRDDYGAEVQRLELAVKRAESVVNKERMDRIQREALQEVSKDEKDKRKQGKGEWYLKKSEKRELLTRARYEALAAKGGKKAVKKAIEKKQRKISQKEKKSRPFSKSAPGSESSRKRSADGDYDIRKRRRAG